MLENFLRVRLKKKLPGVIEQNKMSPIPLKNGYLKSIKKDHKTGSILIIFYKKNNEFYFPLIKRSNKLKNHSSQISFPGGRFDEEDINLKNTALRESNEEIGLKVKKNKVLGTLTQIYIPASNYKVSPYIAFYDKNPQFKLNSFEVDKLIEVSLNQILDKSNIFKKKMKLSSGILIDCPYYYLNGFIVWGATAMILSELCAILKEKF
tara:strand:- start:175 stop:795 length:621 start_codon:yes stop_codon:yes gene_type:complete